MPTTPRYGFPYPAGTDRVMDGDNAMGALALAVEATLGDRFDALNAGEVRATGDLALGTAAADIPGASLSISVPGGPQRVLVFGHFDFNVTAAGVGACLGTLFLDGVQVSGVAAFQPATTGRQSTVFVWVVGLTTAGAHVLKLQASKSVAGGTASVIFGQSGTKLVWIRLPMFAPAALDEAP